MLTHDARRTHWYGNNSLWPFRPSELKIESNHNPLPLINTFIQSCKTDETSASEQGLTNKYRKNSKNWDTLNYYHDCPSNGIMGFYTAILRSKDADRITNRVDTNQTAP